MTSNPFNKHPIHECCGIDELRPQWMFIYFHNGIAYATNSNSLIAVSLSDLHTEESFINFLNGKKIHKDDFKLLCDPYLICIEEPSTIRLSEERGTIIQLSEIDYEAPKGFSMLLQVIETFQIEFNSKRIPVETIKLNLRFIEQISKAIGSLPMAKFSFLSHKNAIYIEFDIYKKSFGVIMAMMDDNKKSNEPK